LHWVRSYYKKQIGSNSIVFTNVCMHECLLVQLMPTSPLRQSIRQTLYLEHIKILIELGEWLDNALVKTRLGAIKLPPSDNETKPS